MSTGPPPAQAESATGMVPPEDPLADIATVLGLNYVDEKPSVEVLDDAAGDGGPAVTEKSSTDEVTAAMSRSQEEEVVDEGRGATAVEDRQQQEEDQEHIIPLRSQQGEDQGEEADDLVFRQTDVPHHIAYSDQDRDGVSTITGVPIDHQDLYPSAFALLRADAELQQQQQQQAHLEQAHQTQLELMQHSVQPLPNSSQVTPPATAALPLPQSTLQQTDNKSMVKTLDGTVSKQGGTAVFVPSTTAISSGKQSTTTTIQKNNNDVSKTKHQHTLDADESQRSHSTSSAGYQQLLETEEMVVAKLPSVGIGVSLTPSEHRVHDMIQEQEGAVQQQQQQQRQVRGQPGAFAVGGLERNANDGIEDNGSDVNDGAAGNTPHRESSPRDIEEDATHEEETITESSHTSHHIDSPSSLAHAREVEEDQQAVPLLIPVAQPMETNTITGAKRQQVQTGQNKCKAYAVLATLVSFIVVAIIVAAIVSNGGDDDVDTGRNTESPDTATASEREARQMAIYARISQALDERYQASRSMINDDDDNVSVAHRVDANSNSQLLKSENSNPYADALHWILDVDPLQLNATAENLLQRYYLVVFYFSTSVDQEWNFCNPSFSVNDTSPTCHYEMPMSSFTEGLLGGQFSDGGGIVWSLDHVNYDETLAARWLSVHHECLWAGIFCSNQTATFLHLENMNLTGTIPPEIDILDDLKSIALSFNDLRGPFPAGIAGLKNLSYLDLEHNQLTGKAMDLLVSRGSMENLRLLRLAYNPLLDPWRIPSDLATVMPNLDSLLVPVSSITGSVPTEIAELSSLRLLSLAGNSEITGPIPSELCLLSNLEEIFFGITLISGVIPSEIGQLSKLAFVDLYNTALTGTIPEELFLGDFDDLLMLDLGYNGLTGTISTNIGQLWFMGFLYLSGNPNLIGTIPTEIGLLEGLQKLHIHGSGFTGTVPTELCDLKDDYLYVINADCFEDSETMQIPSPCPEGCCTKCCDRATGYCEKL